MMFRRSVSMMNTSVCLFVFGFQYVYPRTSKTHPSPSGLNSSLTPLGRGHRPARA